MSCYPPCKLTQKWPMAAGHLGGWKHKFPKFWGEIWKKKMWYFYVKVSWIFSAQTTLLLPHFLSKKFQPPSSQNREQVQAQNRVKKWENQASCVTGFRECNQVKKLLIFLQNFQLSSSYCRGLESEENQRKKFGFWVRQRGFVSGDVRRLETEEILG